MKVLYLECNMGASGDMLMSALLELHPDPKGFLRRLNDLKIPGVSIQAVQAEKCGICGTQIIVKIHGVEETSDHHHHHGHTHEHHPNRMSEIWQIVRHLDLPQRVKDDIIAVYAIIAAAESHVHQKTVEQIHFHEVGMMDAIADITGVCLLMNELGANYVLASPIHVGSGQVACAHGILPVPAPATAYILQDIPIYGGKIKEELCTPTGAALLKYFSSDFVPMPVMKVEKIGYGMGKKDFESTNCLRAMLGESQTSYGSVRG